MKYHNLGTSSLKISQICLGTMTWGEQNTAKEGHDQIDFAFERGVNFFDTAEMYPVPPRAETYAETERIIGQSKTFQQNRDKIILATKVVGPMEFAAHIREGNHRLNLENITNALESSLKRLKTDYVDLYQIHWPARRTNFFGRLLYSHRPESDLGNIEETLEALATIVQRGLIKEIGVSNETPWGIMRYLMHAQKNGLPRIQSIQNPYNLLNRSYEVGLSEISLRENISLLAYSPLAFGALSGKYILKKDTPQCRLNRFPVYQRYNSEKSQNAIRAYLDLAQSWNLDPAQMALAFINQQDFCQSNIIGATNLEQLESNIDSINLELPKDLIEQIEKIHEEYPIPAP